MTGRWHGETCERACPFPLNRPPFPPRLPRRWATTRSDKRQAPLWACSFLRFYLPVPDIAATLLPTDDPRPYRSVLATLCLELPPTAALRIRRKFADPHHKHGLHPRKDLHPSQHRTPLPPPGPVPFFAPRGPLLCIPIPTVRRPNRLSRKLALPDNPRRPPINLGRRWASSVPTIASTPGASE